MRQNILLVGILIICLMLSSCGIVSDAFETAQEQMDDAFAQFENSDGDALNESSTENTESDVTVQENSSADDAAILNSYEGAPLSLFIEKAQEMNYEATFFADGVEFTDFIDSVKDDYITGTLTVDTANKTVIVDLVLASNLELAEKEAALKETLDLSVCWIAAEEYGCTEYGNTFELNYVTGKITESLFDENTWFLKSECTVNGEKRICEARITGSTDNPEVSFFDVY